MSVVQRLRNAAGVSSFYFSPSIYSLIMGVRGEASCSCNSSFYYQVALMSLFPTLVDNSEPRLTNYSLPLCFSIKIHALEKSKPCSKS